MRFNHILILRFSFVALLALVVSCSTDPVVTNSNTVRLSGIVKDSTGHPIAGAAFHILHLLNSNRNPDGGTIIYVTVTIPTKQDLAISIYAPDGLLDTLLTIRGAQAGTNMFSYDPGARMNGISYAVIQTSASTDTMRFVTESVDEAQLKSMRPFTTSQTQGEYSIAKSALSIGSLVRGQDSSPKLDTIGSTVGFVVIAKGYHSAYFQLPISADSNQTHDVIMAKE